MFLVKLTASPAIRFIALSGVGWVLDFLLFWAFVAKLDMVPGMANFVSSTIAAMGVYCASQWMVFRSHRVAVASAVGYLLYTESNILIWALVIQILSGQLTGLGGLTSEAAALAAKVMVTPLSLACNFVVSRKISSAGK